MRLGEEVFAVWPPSKQDTNVRYDEIPPPHKALLVLVQPCYQTWYHMTVLTQAAPSTSTGIIHESVKCEGTGRNLTKTFRHATKHTQTNVLDLSAGDRTIEASVIWTTKSSLVVVPDCDVLAADTRMVLFLYFEVLREIQ